MKKGTKRAPARRLSLGRPGPEAASRFPLDGAAFQSQRGARSLSMRAIRDALRAAPHRIIASEDALYSWQSEGSRPPIEAAKAIAAILGVSLDALKKRAI